MSPFIRLCFYLVARKVAPGPATSARIALDSSPQLEKQMAPRKSPRDSQCPHCKRLLTKGGLKQHLRHVKCSHTSTASPRKFERVRCKHCSKSFHSTNSLRVHVSTRHPREYAKSPGHMENHRTAYRHSGKKSRRESPAQATNEHRHASPNADATAQTRAHPNGAAHRGLEERHRHRGNAKPSGPADARRRTSWQDVLTEKLADASKRQ